MKTKQFLTQPSGKVIPVSTIKKVQRKISALGMHAIQANYAELELRTLANLNMCKKQTT